MNILAIETSCDETALSIIKTSDNNFEVLSDLVISQIDIHAQYGGVFPKLAKREHAKNLVPLLEQSLKESELYTTGNHENLAEKELEEILEREPELFNQLTEFLQKIEKPPIDAVMVTHGPGLAPALWIGVNFARALAVAWDVPLMPVNHMEGHVSSILLKDNYLNQNEALYPLESFDFPMIALLISGGHTQLVQVRNWGSYEIIGETIDDAVGEAFDKVARMLDMEYPGGPKISQSAQQGNQNDSIVLPRPMIDSKDYRFSFSGLKTACRYLIEELKEQNKLNEQTIADISREFEHAVTEVLISKTKKALIEHGAKGLIIAGGVSANTFITDSFRKLIENEFSDIQLFLPEKKLCGDNSLMIASAGFLKLIYDKKNAFTPQSEVKAVSNLKL